MPELPEVETVARGLRERIVGTTFRHVDLWHPTLTVKQDREVFTEKLTNARVTDIRRRAKFLLFHLEPRGVLLGHLRMTGKFIVSPPLPEPGKHHRAWFTLDDRTLLVFEDMRCFGTLEWFPDEASIPQLQKLGPEPLSEAFEPVGLQNALARTRRAIKPVLLDQRVVAGIGNIYASEILFRARIHPETEARTLRKAACTRLVHETREVLTEALAHNGTSISDFRRVDDKTGEFQEFLRVYQRETLPCRVCGTPIQRSVQQQRSTFFCPTCQTP